MNTTTISKNVVLYLFRGKHEVEHDRHDSRKSFKYAKNPKGNDRRVKKDGAGRGNWGSLADEMHDLD